MPGATPAEPASRKRPPPVGSWSTAWRTVSQDWGTICHSSMSTGEGRAVSTLRLFETASRSAALVSVRVVLARWLAVAVLPTPFAPSRATAERWGSSSSRRSSMIRRVYRTGQILPFDGVMSNKWTRLNHAFRRVIERLHLVAEPVLLVDARLLTAPQPTRTHGDRGECHRLQLREPDRIHIYAVTSRERSLPSRATTPRLRGSVDRAIAKVSTRRAPRGQSPARPEWTESTPGETAQRGHSGGLSPHEPRA